MLLHRGLSWYIIVENLFISGLNRRLPTVRLVIMQRTEGKPPIDAQGAAIMMRKKYDIALDSLSDEIKDMAKDLRYNTGLDVLYTGLLMDKYVDIKARKYGQNRSRLDILHTLIAHGGILKPSDLGKMTFRTKQTITKVIDGLERDELVTREFSGKDRRTRKVIVTKKGLDSIRESLPNTMETMNVAMPMLTKKQMEEIGAIMKLIRQHLLAQINAAGTGSIEGDE